MGTIPQGHDAYKMNDPSYSATKTEPWCNPGHPSKSITYPHYPIETGGEDEERSLVTS